MNHRERVSATLNREDPDRVPLDLGGTLAASTNVGALEQRKMLHGREGPAKVLSLRSMIAEVDNRIIEVLWL